MTYLQSHTVRLKRWESLNLEMITCRLEGMTMQEVGDKFGLSPRTIEARMDEMRRIYAARSFVHLIGVLMGKGVIKVKVEEEV